MEQKHVLLSALSVGLGVGLGLAGGQKVTKWAGGSDDVVLEEQIEQELLRQVLNGKDSKVTFDDFPYYLSEQTRVLLTSAAFVHLKHSDFLKHTRNLSPASRAILLTGHTEFYHQMLAKALAHRFESKLLLLDITDFSLKMQRKYGCVRKELSLKKSISAVTMDRMSNMFDSFSIHLRSSSQCSATNSAQPGRKKSWCFSEKEFLQSLYKVLISVSEKSSIVVYLRDVDKLLLQSPRLYNLFHKMLTKLSGPIVVLGSVNSESEDESREIDDRLSLLFPYNVDMKPPGDDAHLLTWKAQLEEDVKMLQFLDNKNNIAEVLSTNDIDCDDLCSICHVDTVIISNHIEEIVASAVSFHLMNNKDPEYRNGKLIISSNSLSHGLSIFQDSRSRSLKLEGKEGVEVTTAEKSVSTAKKDGENQSPTKAPEAPPDNEFEKRIRQEVIPANEIGVTFADIGALDEIKESLQELVMLPLRRPDLFKGGLLKPCRGILLFGPPGTGKTMMAKAIANEAGASFINVSMSIITSKWFGEDEKNVRALFTLAAKVSPTIIFVDEVDSMLGQRTRVGEHEAMRKIKNEFMTHWDGLLTKSGERILVLAATNRPFDLDEAIIRRFERRIMVGLPSSKSREMILKTLLAKEKTEELEFKELATMTEGYSGSDLKNLCVTAAYRPVRELLQQEHTKEKARKKKAEEDKDSAEGTSNAKEGEKEEGVITLRSLNMEDMRQAKNQVAASFACEGSVMSELKQWNELYGEGGSRKKQQLTYFL